MEPEMSLANALLANWHEGEELMRLAADDDPASHLWRDLIWPGNITLIASDPKVGKTTLLVNLLREAEVHGGQPGFCGGRAVRSGSYLYCTEEGVTTLVQAFQRNGHVPKRHLFALSSEFHRGLDDLSKVIIAKVELEERAGNPVIGVILDTFGVWSRIGDMNDYSTVTNALNPVRRIRDETGVGVILVHHTNKAGEGGPARVSSGSFALGGAVDQLIHIGMAEKDPDARILKLSGRMTGNQEVQIKKVEDAAGTWSFVGTSGLRPPSHSRDDEIIALLEEQDMQTGAIGKALGISVAGSLRRRLNKLHEDGVIERVGEHGNATWRLRPQLPFVV